MDQILHSLKSGVLKVAPVPDPAVTAGEVLISNHYSIISAGTEKMALELARKSLIGKAMQRPDQVRRILEKFRTEGILSTVSLVRSKLDESIGLGYSSAGTVLLVGKGVRSFKPGDRVASNGPHAGVVSVPENLCAHIPESLAFEQAAYGILGAIALNAVRLARVSLGDVVLVIGLGLLGQVTVALLKANGARVLGIDPDAWKCDLAMRMGAELAKPDLSATDLADRTRGIGADAVLIAASSSSAGPVQFAAESVRQKGRVVALGAVNLDLPRRPFYFKEAELVVACSYGPGRYDADYEDRGRDYPVGHVRWTAQRNLQSFLELMAGKRIDVSPLTTHQFKIEDGEKAYALIDGGGEKYLGISLEYPASVRNQSLPCSAAQAQGPQGQKGVGVLGAGNFAKNVLLPLIKKSGLSPRVLCSGGGVSASHSAETFGFDVATTDEDRVFADPAVNAVFIVTRHDLHASQILKAVQSKKHVFTEKPLALTEEEVAQIDVAVRDSGLLLMVGFNRRFSAATQTVREFFRDTQSPITVSIRINAGALPRDHWTQSLEEGGGRIIGEACHSIDLATHLTNSPPVRVFAESIGGANAPSITDDQCFITVRHANGSISNIGYLAGGDRGYSKERVEVIGGGKVAVIEDFREVTLIANGKTKASKPWKQDKGYQAEIEAFTNALVRGGASPIAWGDIRAVSLASILAMRSLREGIPFPIQ